MSPRAACLLDLYGFDEVYDYVDGKSDWMAYGLPVEGEDGPFAGDRVKPAPTCQWDHTVAHARSDRHNSHDSPQQEHEHEGHEHDGHDHSHDQDDGHDHSHDQEHEHGRRRAEGADVVVLGPGGLVIGAVDDEALAAAADDALVLDVMYPVPTTVRPSTTLASLMESGDRRALVTTSDGRLLGQVELGPVDEAEGFAEYGEYGAEIAEILGEVQERFGTADPSPEQLRSYFHDRLVAQGRTPEEADQMLAEMEDPEAN